MDTGFSLKPGHVIVYRADYSARDSLCVATLLKSQWTHVNLVVEGGETPMVLNTYPATNADVVPASTITDGREYLVLDLPVGEQPDETWREKVAAAGKSLVGLGYWLSPCSRLTVVAFVQAGVALLQDTQMSWLERIGWLLPEQFVTHTRLRPVFQNFC